MKRILDRLPPPAMVVACPALLVQLDDTKITAVQVAHLTNTGF
jgi:hypothetical protein